MGTKVWLWVCRGGDNVLIACQEEMIGGGDACK